MALKSKSKSGFQYKPRTADQVKNRANRKGGSYDSIFKSGFDTFTPKQGDNLIRYLPPTWDDSEHYGYTVYVHNNIGPDNASYLCARKMLNKPCACCEAMKEAKDAGEADEAKALNYSERIVSWILDREGDDPEKPVIYNQSWTQDRDVTALCVNERSGEILMIDHPDTGYDVAFKRQGTGLKTKYYGWQIERHDSSISENQKTQDQILDYVNDNPIPSTLNFYDYDYIKGVLSGKVAKDDEDMAEEKPARGAKPAREEVEEEEAPFETGKRHRGPRWDNEDGEVDEDDPVPAKRRPARDEGEETPSARKPSRRVVEEEEEETPPPRTSTRARRPEPVDEEENEEETPARKPAARRTVVEDEEEEEATPRRAKR